MKSLTEIIKLCVLQFSENHKSKVKMVLNEINLYMCSIALSSIQMKFLQSIFSRLHCVINRFQNLIKSIAVAVMRSVVSLSAIFIQCYYVLSCFSHLIGKATKSQQSFISQ